MTRPDSATPWPAPERAHPLHHGLSLPGSKSLTNRELVLGALADGPSTLHRPLHARDTALMAVALTTLGATITERPGDGAFGPDLEITPITPGARIHATIDCGLAGTVMRFVPPLAAIMSGSLTFTGDLAARRRPMGTTLDALAQLGLSLETPSGNTLPFTVSGGGVVNNTTVTINASASSQFVSGLLLVGARLPDGLRVQHRGEHLPSLPHIDMTIQCLRARGVAVSTEGEGVWVVQPGPIGAENVVIEPDLSNAAPFLAAGLITGGSVRITGWPATTTQVGGMVPELLERFGATIHRDKDSVTVGGGLGWRNGMSLPGVDMDLSHAGELAPTFITLATLSSEPSIFRGIGHLRGHETDRLAALVENIRALGGDATETADGIAVSPTPLDGGHWKAFDDHRMATSGALLGLGVRGIVVDDIGCTAKTLPEFPELWSALVGSPAP